MRISDWSSDVCSSDLYGEQSGPVAAELEEAGLSPVEALLLDSCGQPVAWRSLARLIARQDQGRQPKAPEEDSIADATEKLVIGATRLNASGSGQPIEQGFGVELRPDQQDRSNGFY